MPEINVLEYLDFDKHPMWIGSIATKTYNTTWDGGSTWTEENYKMVFGCYFFLSESKVIQTKNLANIVDVIVNLEGIAALVFLLMRKLPKMVNAKQLEAKSIRTLFFDCD